MTFKVPEHYRFSSYDFPNDHRDGNNGAFRFHLKAGQAERHVEFFAIASDGEGWEHVSVSLPDRTPTWEEMHAIKGLFWGEEDCVVQYHPPKSDYVNAHPYCLHLWRPTEGTIPRPPSDLVGPKA